jgi:hypothetical protein
LTFGALALVTLSVALPHFFFAPLANPLPFRAIGHVRPRRASFERALGHAERAALFVEYVGEDALGIAAQHLAAVTPDFELRFVIQDFLF